MSKVDKLVEELLDLDRRHPDADVLPFKRAALVIRALIDELEPRCPNCGAPVDEWFDCCKNKAFQ